MKTMFMKLWKEEDGAETAEWVVIVAVLLLVSVFIYQGVLQDALSNSVNSIDDQIAAVQ